MAAQCLLLVVYQPPIVIPACPLGGVGGDGGLIGAGFGGGFAGRGG